MEQNEKSGKLLEVKDLRVSFFTPAGEVKAVSGISYDLDYDEVMGIVGESGSGKSQEAYSIMGLLQSPGKVIGGSITFEGRDVLAFSKKEMASFRGSEVAMIFQNPMTASIPFTPWATSSSRPCGPTTRRSPRPTPPSGPWRCWSWWASTMWPSG